MAVENAVRVNRRRSTRTVRRAVTEFAEVAAAPAVAPTAGHLAGGVGAGRNGRYCGSAQYAILAHRSRETVRQCGSVAQFATTIGTPTECIRVRDCAGMIRAC